MPGAESRYPHASSCGNLRGPFRTLAVNGEFAMLGMVLTFGPRTSHVRVSAQPRLLQVETSRGYRAIRRLFLKIPVSISESTENYSLIHARELEFF